MKLTNSYGEIMKISKSDYLKFEELAADQIEIATLVAEHLEIEEEELLEALVLAGFRLDDASKQQKKIVRLAYFWRIGHTKDN